MKHASPEALAELSALLEQLRALPGLIERKPGIFYRGSTAFLHFHEDPAGLFADAKVNGAGFARWPVDTAAQQQSLLRAVRLSMTRKASGTPQK
ncbi:hypothetical protein [Aquabacterium humicola]|uniref:hypothetical protein n=1 Tax=Aquabacterium humicola TaxID=3237377 RepID=UPI002542E7B4|nr:hypothetical protein [Rubrivivax pictus]